jgi:hypothetical protein
MGSSVTFNDAAAPHIPRPLVFSQRDPLNALRHGLA